MDFFAVVYDGLDLTRIFLSSRRVQQTQFKTSLTGGFVTASFLVPLGLTEQARYSGKLLGKPVIVSDSYGTVVFDGLVDDVGYSAEGMSISCSGRYSIGKNFTHGLVYPSGDSSTIRDIIVDTINLSDGYWVLDYGVLYDNTGQIAPQDYFDTKLNDVIEEITKYGTLDAVTLRPTYFAVWENGVAEYGYVEDTANSLEADWVLFANADSINANNSETLDGVFNKVQVVFQDANGNSGVTSWFEDSLSQDIFGVREGTVNLSTADTSMAELVAELYLKYSAYPKYQATIEVDRVVRGAGARMKHTIRAGDTVTVLNSTPYIIPTAANIYDASSSVVVVHSTSYDAQSDKMTLELGSAASTLSLYLTKLGVEGSSIK